MSFHKDIERINLLILEGRVSDAEEHLKALAPQDEAERRTKAHFQAISLFRKGETVAAKEMMETALAHYGENVNLLRDLLVCQYRLNDMMGFRANLFKLETILLEKQSELSSRSLLECELMVGKFLEEEARLKPALDLYTRAFQRAANPMQRLRALIQKSRWHALYEPCEELSTFYRELITVPPRNLTADLRIELEHTLVLIELRLVGSDHAWQRVARLDSTVSEVDQRLMFFDFIEGALGQDMELSAVVLEKMNSFTELDPYEQHLSRLVKGSLQSLTMVHELALLAPQLPWASYLRLLCLAANLEANASTRSELNRKIQLIIGSLDPKSQSLWNQRLKQALQSPEIRMEYSSRNRSVAIQGRSVDLSKKKMGLQLLEGLAVKPELSVDEAIGLLWQASFSPEHYHRLRMGIHRLNTLINKVTGLGKIIEVDSQTVRLRPEVKIRRAEEAFNL